MTPIEIREIIIADRKDGMTINAISQAVRVSESAIYRLFQKKRDTGSIEPSYQNCGRPPEANAENLNEMENLVTSNDRGGGARVHRNDSGKGYVPSWPGLSASGTLHGQFLSRTQYPVHRGQ